MKEKDRPRLILNNCENSLKAFEAYARAAKALKDEFEVRVIINHLHRARREELRDPEDPLPLYFTHMPNLRDFVFHRIFKGIQAPAFVRANLRLMRAKAAILEKQGLKAAFFAHEPVYLPESFFVRRPHWRGPRVDHPRRSLHALFAPCFHEAEVRAAYAEMVEALVRDFPILDTFMTHGTNDSGAGFCHYPAAYFGPNGPEQCKGLNPALATAAYAQSMLDGARAGGVREPRLLIGGVSAAWQGELMPDGAHLISGKKGQGAFLGTAFAAAYPVRFLQDPLRLLEQTAEMRNSEPATAVLWLNDEYSRAAERPDAVAQQVAVFQAAWRAPEKVRTLEGRLALCRTVLEKFSGKALAEEALEGFVELSRVFRLLEDNPMRLRGRLGTYGAVSHRWLTRPFIAAPGELSPGEEGYFLPHVFCAYGAEWRRNLLDLHGKLAINPAGDYDAFTQGLNLVVRHLETARRCFLKAGQGRSAAAAGALGLVLKSCRNALEFAALRDNAQLMPADHRAPPLDKAGHPIGWMSAYHKIVYRVLRSELDTAEELRKLVKADKDGVVVRARKPGDEDTFLLAPDLAGQLALKRRIMLRRWQDVMRLEPLKERLFQFIYW